MIRCVVAGGRDFSDRVLLFSKLDYYLNRYLWNQSVLIIHGACSTGADKFADEYAREKGLECMKFPADWELGKKAGPIRNEEMAKVATHCIAFWDGKSKGTGSMIKLAEKYNLNLRIVRYSP